MTASGPLLLAGGGHSHALLLKRWAMTPRLRPKRGVVLVNRHPTALYSGMVPGLIAGIYRQDELSLNLPHLCDRAGVAFVQAEILGVDSQRQDLLLHQRPSLRFGLLSLDVGAVTRNADDLAGVPIKPLETALQFLSQQDPRRSQTVSHRWCRTSWNRSGLSPTPALAPSRPGIASPCRPTQRHHKSHPPSRSH